MRGVKSCTILIVLITSLLVPGPSSLGSAVGGEAVSIPVGRIGDQVEYTHTLDATTEHAVEGTNERHATTRQTLVVGPPLREKDAVGDPHPALEIAWFEDPDEGAPFHHVSRFDLASRDIVSLASHDHSANVTPEGFAVDSRTHFVTAAPGVWSFGWAWPDRAEVRFQGRTLAYGALEEDSFASMIRADAEGYLDNGPGHDYGRLDEFGLTGNVTRVPDGALVTSHIRFGGTTTQWTTDGAYRVRLVHVETLRATYSADSPYPVTYDRTAEDTAARLDDGSILAHSRSHESWTLRRQQAGSSSAIPWAPLAAPAYRGSNTTLERSPPGATHPADGSSHRPFLLREAITSVENDPSLVRFRAWRALHPTARVMGIDGGALGITGFNDYVDRGPGWALVYAAPGSDSSFLVISVLRDGRILSRDNGALPLNGADAGEYRLAPELQFSESDVPTTFLSIGALEDVLADQGLPRDDRVAWGFSRHDLARGSQRPLGSPIQVPVAQLLRRAHAGNAILDVSSGALDGYYAFDTKVNFLGVVPWYTNEGNMAHVPVDGARPSLAGDVAIIAALGVLVLLAWLAQGLRYGLFAFYTRLRGAELLDHDVRDRLVALVNQEPGISPPELHKTVGGGWSTVMYHLTVLEREGFVTSLLDGRHRRYFSTGLDRRLHAALAALRNERTRQVYELLKARPGIERGVIAAAIGISAPGTLFHIKRLERAGLLESRRVGRLVLYSPRTPVQPPAPA